MAGKRVRNKNSFGAVAEHGGNSTDQIMDLLYDVDISQPHAVTFSDGTSGNIYSPADPTNIPRIRTPWEFRSGIVKLLNPAATFAYTLAMPAIVANQTLNWPTITSTDTLAVLSNLLNKSSLNSNIVYKDQNNNLGAFFQDIQEIAAPASPSANTGRVFFDSSDEHLKIKKSGGSVVDLETVGAVSTLNDLSDSTITSPTTNQILQYNGTQWVNATFTSAAHKNNHRSGGTDAFIKGDDLVASAMYLQDIADPTSDAQRLWLVDAGLDVKYWDDQAVPVKQVLERQSNRNVASGYCGLDASAKVALAQLGGITNNEISASAAIAKTKLAALNLVNSDISASAAITEDKLVGITDEMKVPWNVRFDWSHHKPGALTLTSATGAEGIWAGHIVSTGTYANHVTSTTNWRMKFDTAATTNAQAGIRTDFLWCKGQYTNNSRGFALRTEIRWPTNQAQWRGFFGLSSGFTGGFPTGGLGISTWGATQNLVGVWCDETTPGSQNVRKHHNDGLTSTPGSDLSPTTAISSGDTDRTIMIIFDEVTPKWTIDWEGTANDITSDMPAGDSAAMGLLMYVETKEAVAKNFEINWCLTNMESR